MSKLSVAIADDNERILQLLGEIVSNDEELQVVGTAKDGEEAYKLIKDKEPDVVLLDIVMPKLDGLGVLDRVYKDKEMDEDKKDAAMRELKQNLKDDLKAARELITQEVDNSSIEQLESDYEGSKAALVISGSIS